MKILLTSVLFTLASTTIAFSNCYNSNDEDAVIYEFTTCFNGSCVDDIMLWECATPTWFGTEFRSGFQVSCKTAVEGKGYNQVSEPKDCKYFLGQYQLKQEHLELFTCMSKEPEGFGCSWFPNGNGG